MDNMSSPLSSSPRLTSSEQRPPTLPSNQKHHSPLISEIIGETFPPFDHQVNIVTPFNDETNRDMEFERGLSFVLFNQASLDVIYAQKPSRLICTSCQSLFVFVWQTGRRAYNSSPNLPCLINTLLPFSELSNMLLDVIIHAHAWSSARSKQESTLAAQNIEQKIVMVIEKEKEQGMFSPASSSPSHFPLSLPPTIVGRQRSIFMPLIHLRFSSSRRDH